MNQFNILTDIYVYYSFFQAWNIFILNLCITNEQFMFHKQRLAKYNMENMFILCN